MFDFALAGTQQTAHPWTVRRSLSTPGQKCWLRAVAMTGVFVATAISMSPDVITVSPNGETVSMELTAPANTAWAARTVEFSEQLFLLNVSPASPSTTPDRCS